MRRRFALAPAALVASLAVAPAAAAAPAIASPAASSKSKTTCATVTTAKACSDVAVIEKRIFQLTNVERKKNDLAPLTPDVKTDAVARDWSQTMARTSDFVHRPDWAWLDEVGPWRTGGENIYTLPRFQSTNDELAARAVKGWMESPGHRKNILNPRFTRLGVGAAQARDGAIYLTQNFWG